MYSLLTTSYSNYEIAISSQYRERMRKRIKSVRGREKGVCVCETQTGRWGEGGGVVAAGGVRRTRYFHLDDLFTTFRQT